MTKHDDVLAAYPKLGQLICGDFRTGGGRGTAPVLNPSRNVQIAEYEMATEQDMDDALAGAWRGYKVWRATSAYERAKVLINIANTMRARREELAGLVSLELGKPYKEALGEVEQAAGMFEWGGEEGKRCYGRIIPAREPGAVQMALREPIGPIAAISSWNAPLITPSRKIGGALGAGCSIILKASELTPACALTIGKIAYECGLPEGVLSIVIGEPVMISGKLMQSDIIRGVTFTGSTRIGKLLTGQAVATMKRPIMELGGHAPVIVMPDIDIEKSIAGAIRTKFRNSGQICTSPTRFMVHEDIYEDYTQAMAEAASKLVIGDAFDPETTMGPLSHQGRVGEMRDFVDDARDRGLRVVTGGETGRNDGAFFRPTVLADTTTDAKVSNVEPFGPIAAMSSFSNLDDALEAANRLPFGLASYVQTGDLKVAQRCITEIEAGSVIVNGWRVSLPETPFGGHKDSGIASEGGVEGIAAFQNVKFAYQI